MTTAILARFDHFVNLDGVGSLTMGIFLVVLVDQIVSVLFRSVGLDGFLYPIYHIMSCNLTTHYLRAIFFYLLSTLTGRSIYEDGSYLASYHSAFCNIADLKRMGSRADAETNGCWYAARIPMNTVEEF